MSEVQGNLIDIHKGFAATEFGEMLAERVRYEKYKPEDITNQEWVKLLGADVNNLTHLPLTYGLTRAFINASEELQPGYLDTDEQNVLRSAALIHDWAEAIVGDISFGDKTEHDEAAEQEAFESNLARFYTGDATDLINRARTEVVFNKDGKLATVFNAIERAGYLRTALRANQHILKNTAPQSCTPGLKWLVADVLSNQPVALIEHAKNLRPVEQYLANRRYDIETAFYIVRREPAAIFANYGDNVEPKYNQFSQAYETWTQWLALQQAI